jgi:hypothetical protein
MVRMSRMPATAQRQSTGAGLSIFTSDGRIIECLDAVLTEIEFDNELASEVNACEANPLIYEAFFQD